MTTILDALEAFVLGAARWAFGLAMALAGVLLGLVLVLAVFKWAFEELAR